MKTLRKKISLLPPTLSPPLPYFSGFPPWCKVWIFRSCRKQLPNSYPIRNFTLNNFACHDQFNIQYSLLGMRDQNNDFHYGRHHDALSTTVNFFFNDLKIHIMPPKGNTLRSTFSAGSHRWIFNVIQKPYY